MKITNKIIPFLVAILGLFVGYFFANPLVFDFCQRSYETSKYVGCLDKTIELIGYPFLNFFILVLPITLIALFFKKELFSPWVRFSFWWIPLSLFSAYFAPVTSGQTFVIFEVTHDGTARFFGILFAWMSFVMFVKSLDVTNKTLAFFTKNIAILTLTIVVTVGFLVVNQEAFCGGTKCFPIKTTFAWNVLFTVLPALVIEIVMISIRFLRRVF